MGNAHVYSWDRNKQCKHGHGVGHHLAVDYLVTTDEGAITDIVENRRNGLIVKKMNPEVLADVLEELISDGAQRNMMSKVSREKFELNYTLKKIDEPLPKL